MQNTMKARREDIDSIIALTAAQEKLGVIGSDIQLAGAQELGTYLSRRESLEKLIPVMNNMLAQQYGLNASQEQAAQIASMLGKVMDGQVGALSRYGYKFDAAQEKLLKYGNEAQRVAVLFDVVSASVGGVNQALAQTPEGMLKQQQNMQEGQQARLGKTVVAIKAAFAPLVSFVMDIVEKILPIIEGLVKPLTSGIQHVVNLMKGVNGETSNWGYYANQVKDIFKNYVLPTVSQVWKTATNIVAKMVEFAGKSELVKDIFKAVVRNIKLGFIVLETTMKQIESFFNKVVMPMLKTAEALYNIHKIMTGGKPLSKTGGYINVKAPPEKKEKSVWDQMYDALKNIGENTEISQKNESTILGGGQKVVNISVAKFLDNINISTMTLQEGAADVERIFLEMFSRVLVGSGQ